MQTPPVPLVRFPVTRADGRPAYVAAPPFVTATLCREHGGYEAARRALGEGNRHG